MPFETPVLFLIFNRTDTTQQVFNAIREAKPKHLYVAADGARPNREGEAEKCQQTRDIIKQVDWDCEVKTLFRTENLGCGLAVSSAITWFFDNVEQGIILEDDCLPHPDFFMYCRELLERYRDNDEVMFIGGTNHQLGIERGDASYYFSAFSHVWGWASWRSSWEKYHYDVSGISLLQFENMLNCYFKEDASIIRYYKRIFKLMQQHKIDTWDYQWTFSIWINKGLAIIPNKNLVSNIGFGENATHTSAKKNRSANLPTSSIRPIKHPNAITQNKKADFYYARKFYHRDSIFKILKTPVYFVRQLLKLYF
ncbi:hemolytic protein HlpA [Bacteroidia bacterium]|nr:hemolytic protein HlpA [Bacteroidia bacterium]